MGSEIVLAVIGLLLALRSIQAYLRTGKDPDWERRWNQLPQLQREHIAKAVRQGIPLTDPEETELAAGLARQQRSTSKLISHPGVIHLLLAAVILLTFLMKSSPLGLAPILLLLAFLVWILYRERTTRRNLDRAEQIFTP
jgi:Flp pilus assembly protein TadB